MKIGFLSFVFSFVIIHTYAQEEKETSPLTVSGYAEVYYTYDFNQPANNTRPPFIYSHNRHNEVNLNLGVIKAAYNKYNVRANLALMAGTYPNANLTAEPGVLKNIYEANVGVKLSQSKDLWLDAGVFTSHVGFESAMGKDCWTLTRSILAENSPYYEAGAKVSYNSTNGKWFLSALILNGWQRIQRVDGNSIPSFGTQVTVKPAEGITLNSSTFIGTDKPDSVRQMRYFHNFYGIFQLSQKIGLTIGFDYGVEEKALEESGTNAWFSPVVIAKFVVSDKVSIGLRGEYYDDEQGVIISTGTPNGFKTTGISANMDYQIASNTVWRFEIRKFNSKDDVFVKADDSSNTNTFVATALAISF